MKKQIKIVMLCAMVTLLVACQSASEEVKTPEPTATATPEPTATATPEPTATATPEPTATATPEPTATATPEPTATATPEPTATATPEPTATATPEPTATATPEPTATVIPEPEAVFQTGLFTEEGYENEWLDIRITLPKGASLVNESTDSMILVEFEMGAYRIPIVQFIVEKTFGKETARSHIESVQKDFSKTDKSEGLVYSFGKEPEWVEIGGQDYLKLFMKATADDDIAIYQNYCVRIHDEYRVVIVFTYLDGFERELEEAVNAFSSITRSSLNTEEFQEGILTGNIYENSWAGMRFIVPEEALIEESGASVLSVTWLNTFLNVEIDMSNGKGLITEERYLELMKEALCTQIDASKTEPEDVSCTVSDEYGHLEIAGREYMTMDAEVALGEMRYCIKTCVREQEGYLICIMLSYLNEREEDLEMALNAFFEY